ncbi:MAG: AIPR family protein [Planctomycetes bacterium]|nr:AIPR family protein [Planctomycetota bacterium]
MPITDKQLDQAYSDLKGKCGGVRNDYFGLLYLEQEFRVPRDFAINQVAFGGNDYGLDGFHFDADRRNLYLFQFKYSESHTQFKESFHRLIGDGMERVFDARTQDARQNDLLLQLRSCLLENQAVIDKVYIHFVFLGDPSEAERSAVLDKLREDLENKKHLIDKCFGRAVTLLIEYRSGLSRKAGTVSHQRTTHRYDLEITGSLERTGPGGERLIVGLARVCDLHRMYAEMGQRFFERNIRSSLGEELAANRALERAFRRIVIERTDDPSIFAFNHNGVSFAAEEVEIDGTRMRVTEPRLLNGAQTVTTFARFLAKNEGDARLRENAAAIEGIHVLCKVIADAPQDFVTSVTINNNRQNPVEPWSLHANDTIQLELHDKFRDDVGVFYERQLGAFKSMSDNDLDSIGITARKPVELLPLAQTLLVTDGEIDKLSSMRRVFEDERIYESVFSAARLRADTRQILLCYKVRFRLRRLLNDIIDKGPNKYEYMSRARNLLWALVCQGILNAPDLDELAESYGRDMTVPADFTERLSALATTRCRFLISDVVGLRENAERLSEGNLNFLRANASYKKCMDFAHKRWKWVEKRLK